MGAIADFAKRAARAVVGFALGVVLGVGAAVAMPFYVAASGWRGDDGE